MALYRNEEDNSKRDKKIIGEQDLPKTIRVETNEMNEIIKIGIYENRNISEAKIHKVWKIEKLVQGTRNRCKAKKVTKLIGLNYNERGKRQQIYNYFYIISILYTTIIFLHINLFFMCIS